MLETYVIIPSACLIPCAPAPSLLKPNKLVRSGEMKSGYDLSNLSPDRCRFLFFFASARLRASLRAFVRKRDEIGDGGEAGITISLMEGRWRTLFALELVSVFSARYACIDLFVLGIMEPASRSLGIEASATANLPGNIELLPGKFPRPWL